MSLTVHQLIEGEEYLIADKVLTTNTLQIVNSSYWPSDTSISNILNHHKGHPGELIIQVGSYCGKKHFRIKRVILRHYARF